MKSIYEISNKIKCLFLIVLFFNFQNIISQNTSFLSYNQEIIGTKYSIKMIPIKSGVFDMGSPKNEIGRFIDEGPVNKVELSPFWIGAHEITWEVYELFVQRSIDDIVNNNRAKEVDLDADAISGATTPYTDMSFGMGLEGFPAVCMTQLAASKFCEWLSAITGNYYRLPTEAEWEYACRAGTKTRYSFGNDIYLLDQYAWYSDNSGEKYQKVGTKKPNTWGLYDMHGNVAEWTLDQYTPSAYFKRKKTIKDPYIIAFKEYPRVVRGGSWYDSQNKLRSASRTPSDSKWKRRDPQIPKSIWWHTDAPFVGIRIVRPFNPPSIEEQEKYWIKPS